MIIWRKSNIFNDFRNFSVALLKVLWSQVLYICSEAPWNDPYMFKGKPSYYRQSTSASSNIIIEENNLHLHPLLEALISMLHPCVNVQNIKRKHKLRQDKAESRAFKVEP